MINAGIMIIDKHGKDNVSLLFPIFENYLNKKVHLCSIVLFSGDAYQILFVYRTTGSVLLFEIFIRDSFSACRACVHYLMIL